MSNGMWNINRCCFSENNVRGLEMNLNIVKLTLHARFKMAASKLPVQLPLTFWLTTVLGCRQLITSSSCTEFIWPWIQVNPPVICFPNSMCRFSFFFFPTKFVIIALAVKWFMLYGVSMRAIVKVGKRTIPTLCVDIISKTVQIFPFKLSMKFYEASRTKRLCKELVKLKIISLWYWHFTMVFLVSLNSRVL